MVMSTGTFVGNAQLESTRRATALVTFGDKGDAVEGGTTNPANRAPTKTCARPKP